MTLREQIQALREKALIVATEADTILRQLGTGEQPAPARRDSRKEKYKRKIKTKKI